MVAMMMLLVTGCATTSVETRKPLTQEAIIQLAKAKTPDSEVVQRIKASGTVYRLSTVEILHLHESGVSNSVIDYMLQDYADMVRWQERQRCQVDWYFYGPHCYWNWPPPPMMGRPCW